MNNQKNIIVGACALLVFVVTMLFVTLGSANKQEISLTSDLKEEHGDQLTSEAEKLAEDNEEKELEKELEKEADLEIALSKEKSEQVVEKETKREQKTASRGSQPVERTNTKQAAQSTNNSKGLTDDDIYWLAKMIHAEARGESYEGQVAVGAVILHRVAHSDFPNTVYGVIFDKWDGKYYQFSPVLDGSIHLEPNQSALNAARDAANGWDPSGGALYFYNPADSTSEWIFSRTTIKVIGNHVFAI